MDKKLQKQIWTYFKRGFVFFFILLVIGSFIVGMVVSPWSTRQGVPQFRIAQIKKEMYSYQPNSSFYYIYSFIRQNLASRLKGQLDETALNQYAISQSVQVLINYGSIYQFAQDNGIQSSPDALRGIIESSIRGYLYKAPDKGLLDYAEMQYANNALEGQNGDIVNTLSVITYAELYSFYDLENYKQTAEFLYLDITNYIASRLTPEQIQTYYNDNFSKYVNEITIEEISTKTNAIAYNFNKDALQNGWDKTLEKYKGQVAYIKTVTLKDARGVATRYTAALRLKKDGISPKPLFENREYHVLKLDSYPSLKSLSAVGQKAVFSEFVYNKFTDLRVKYDGDIKNAAAKAEASLKSSSDFKKAAAVSGFKYVFTDKLTPVSTELNDDKGNPVTIPVLENNEWMDFLFTSAPSVISKTFYTDGYILIMKVLKKGVAKNLVYQNLGKDTAVALARYKDSAGIRDWFNSVEARYPHVIYENDIKELFKDKKEQQ